ncbi:NAD(P)H-binding protein [Deinococcus sp. KNUC1210]|uniref:SDR family oxidoreductase n=1 Tax=Deinococcus sp. KNUC1210 TaxID=2917691 RepID=UPI001EEFA8F6|nr:NAD(P)H-binding protein [Deinococcus sp. KNUC1210]ULH15702.1 NAD(P)H-binding protein [Deinococcus sp. KNUC1210]
MLVTGGTGNLGRLVVPELVRAGLTVRVLTRQSAPAELPGAGWEQVEWQQGEYHSGAGLAAALEGVDTVLHTAHDPQHPAQDVLGVERLLGYSRAAGLRHFVQVGIVGAAQVPGFAYYAAKTRAETLVTHSGFSTSVFRATQFHGFVASLLLGLERLPVVLVPAGTLQPVEIGEVAQALARHVIRAEPGSEDFAGPEILSLTDLTRLHLAARGLNRRVVSVRLPLPALRAIRAGVLTSSNAARGQRTFEQWLAGQGHGQ